MTQVTSGLPELTLETCHHCGELVPVGAFCGNCGAHLAEPGAGARRRLHAYAAAPHEPVLRPLLISTLFPHLPHRHTHLFRDMLLGGIVLVAILCAVRVFAAATVAAAVLLPILYLLYLFEVEVYEREPLLVVLTTFVAGAALGVGFALVTQHFAVATLHPRPDTVLVQGVLFPVIAQLLMLAGPLLLLGRPRFDETLDGLTFGAASALGFTMAAIVAGSWHTLTAPLVGSGVAIDDALRLLQRAVFGAAVNAGSTAVITSALWLRRSGRRRGWHGAIWRELPVLVGLAFAVQILLGILSQVITDQLGVVVAWGIGAGVMLVALRVVVHHALLDEGAEHEIGQPSACAECHRLVPTMLFCPACGAARSAAPKRALIAGGTSATSPSGATG
ncbi:MAG: PrsW family intramembrane metalloprotease [Candidatus Dormibacteraeota bacterium]|nr:PrsW family intramembrane metalloprotease [Candidatus Dormibacteraeota bacterium]MBV9526177.1 PrsW family intramembrane metalloprotease [Candidatus Dormibacteraeota bacterium]